MRIAISFDYDSPAGYRESFGKQHCAPDADYRGTEALLRVLKSHNVRATFAVVGRVAQSGEIPDHCPDQIRQIDVAGHEVASHSMYHKFIPAMSDRELLEDVQSSRAALEACLGKKVTGFIPPFNRPAHFPQKFAFSLSERLGTQGRGRGRQSLASLLTALSNSGFTWSRVSFKNSWHTMAKRLGLPGSANRPAQPFLFKGVVAVPLHSTGFTDSSIALVRSSLLSDTLITLYAHPNQALASSDTDSESADNLDKFLTLFRREKEAGTIHFQTMAEVDTAIRARRLKIAS